MIFLLIVLGLIGAGYGAYWFIKAENYTHLVLFCWGVLLLSGCGLFFSNQQKESVSPTSEVLVVGISADFPPFSFMRDEQPVGFDIDLMQEIAQRLGKKCELNNMPFGTLLPSLQLGRLEVVAAGLTATPERAQQVLFTTPYLEGEPLVIVSMNAAPAKTVEDLQNKEVVVNEGYTADMYVSTIKGLHITRLKSPADAFLALSSGRSFAFVTAQNTVKPFFDQYGAQQFHVAALPNTSENASLAIAPCYKDLHQQIQVVIDAFKHDGTLQKLKNKWGL